MTSMLEDRDRNGSSEGGVIAGPSQGASATSEPGHDPVESGHNASVFPVRTAAAASRDLQAFRSWALASVAPPSLEQDMLRVISRCGPGDLPAMLDIVGEAELRCLAEVAGLNRRRREALEVVDSPVGARLRLIVHSELSSRWNQRITWLRDVRRYLQDELRRDSAAS